VVLGNDVRSEEVDCRHGIAAFAERPDVTAIGAPTAGHIGGGFHLHAQHASIVFHDKVVGQAIAIGF
jgi:hypothetical protein